MPGVGSSAGGGYKHLPQQMRVPMAMWSMDHVNGLYLFGLLLPLPSISVLCLWWHEAILPPVQILPACMQQPGQQNIQGGTWLRPQACPKPLRQVAGGFQGWRTWYKVEKKVGNF